MPFAFHLCTLGLADASLLLNHTHAPHLTSLCPACTAAVDEDDDYEPKRRGPRRNSALAGPSRFALESSTGGSSGGAPLELSAGAAAGGGNDRATSPAAAFTPEEAASSQRALVAGRGPGLPVVDGRIVKPRPGSGWPGPSPEGWEGQEPPSLDGKNALPNYVHVRQNVWVSKPRPK